MDKDDNQTHVLLEDINSKFEAVLEIISSMQDKVAKIPKMSERVEKLEHDMSFVRLATSNTSHDLETIKIRTEKLENINGQIDDLTQRVKALESTA